jgi:acyl-homoserine-lactone acylase
LVAACDGVDSVEVDGAQVDIRDARQVIANYNGQLDLDSKGAVLFREWLTAYDYGEMLDKSSLFAVPFDAKDPVNTPRGLSDKQVAAKKLGHAVQVLGRAGLALDSTLADAQFAFRSGTDIAIPGGNRHEGVANLMLAGSGDWRGYKVGATKIDGSSTLTDKGYPVIHGSSFLLCLSFTDDGPHAEAVLSYSQSGDPSSPHYIDQTRLFAKEQLRPVLFRQKDIEANTISSKVLTASQ